MRSSDYQYFYLKRHPAPAFLKKYIPKLDKHDTKKYLHQIGEYLYEFEIVDQWGSWRVLKTHPEIVSFLETQHNYYAYSKEVDKLKKFENADSFGDQKFQIEVPPSTSNLPIPDYVVKFFEIYHTNVRKTTSFLMQKKGKALTKAKKCATFCFGSEWTKKRIIITKQGVIQMADNGEVTDFLKYDLLFSMQSGTSATEHQFGIALNSAQRRVDLKARNAKQFSSFLYFLSDAMNVNASKASYGASNPRSSQNCIDYYVDAQQYYEAVAREIDNAKRDIMICGWWVSPQLQLIRPLSKQDPTYWRLDKLLQRKAQSGVRIYILVFFAPSVIPNNSDHTKTALMNLHPNIQVQRHPHEVVPKLWSHHEKAVIVDQRVALMGGLDLCYGRYDGHDHPVHQNGKQMYPGIDYNNVRIKDFVMVQKHGQDLQDRNLPRMPWHDVAFKVRGKIVADVSNHFVEYWNFTLIEKSVAPLLSQQRKPLHMRHIPSHRENLEKEQKIQSSHELNPQNDEPIDIMELVGNILRIATQKEEKQFEQFLESKETSDEVNKKISQEIQKKKFDLNAGLAQRGLLLSIESLGLLKKDSKMKEQESKYPDELQLLRSASQWSTGLAQGVVERSIQNAYLSAIKNAKSYIYIENQFFISATGQKNSEQSFIKNQIANALFDRIKKAIQNKQKFKVVVFMPLLPGMQGQLNQKCPLSLKLTMYWQFNTISQSKYSLLKRVAEITDHPEDYIEFYSLRNHGILGGRPVTQLIYIHTKLMIVDDHIVICGSANINDRSQEGNRDSELAVIFLGGQKTTARMNQKQFNINKKAHELRVKLYMQHFGITEQEAEDPLNPITVKLTRQIAKTNTETYRDIWGCCPDDNVKKLMDVKSFEKPEYKSKELYTAHNSNFKGHAVQFPSMFLSEQRLKFLKRDLPVQDLFA